MKFLIAAIFLFLGSYDGFGQVINGDFEEWDGDVPIGWSVGYSADNRKSEASYSGLYSFHINHPPAIGIFLHNNARSLDDSWMYEGMTEGGFRIPRKANQLTCWYKASYTSQVEAYIFCVGGFSQNGSKIRKEWTTLGSTSQWSKIVLATFEPITDTTNDSLALSFIFGFSGPTSYYKFDIDVVQFDTVVKSVRQNGVSSSKIISISPNPVKNIAYVNYSVGEQSYIQTILYTVDGKKLKELSSTESVYGSGRIPLDLDDIPNGFYYLLCRINGEVVTKPVIISR